MKAGLFINKFKRIGFVFELMILKDLLDEVFDNVKGGRSSIIF